MKSRKQRIDSQKQQLLSQNLRSVKRVTTYLGTTFLMGTAGFSLNKEKAQADTVQVDQNNTTNLNETVNNNTDSTGSTTNETVAAPQTVNVPTTYASNVQTFLQNIAGPAQQVAQQRGLYASLMIAQAAVESGWGGSYLSTSAYNLFGVKWSGAGAYIELPTQEYYNGSYHTVYDKFQRYSSYTESLNGYANVITSRFPNSTRANAANYQIAAHNLRNGVYGTYATAPDYAEKLIRVIETYNLTVYDTGQSQATGNNTPSQAQVPSQSELQATGTYTVKSGDNLYRIALAHSMSVQALKSLNNLSSDTIYVGQTLKVSGQTQSQTQNQAPSQGQTPSQAQSQATGTYTVKSGDNLYRIALAHSMSVQALKSLNNLSSDTIYVGQTLKVSGQTQSQTQNQAPSQGQTSSQAQSQATGTYTVKAGDSLYRIAREHNMSLQALKTLNGLTSELILPGQQLKTAGNSQAVSNSSTNASTNSTQNKPQVTSNSEYVVKAGDTLWSIANAHKMTLATLKQLNNMNSDLIRVGQKLKVTASSESKPAQNTSTATEYTVKAGDSLWKIASKNATTVNRIKALNGLASDLIYVGQKLKLR